MGYRLVDCLQFLPHVASERFLEARFLIDLDCLSRMTYTPATKRGGRVTLNKRQ
jgi:hypothetical protein